MQTRQKNKQKNTHQKLRRSLGILGKEKTYFIRAFGCQFNKAEAEKISQKLEKMGYKLSPKIEGADLIVILMCSVRQKSVDKIINLILNLKSQIANLQLKSKILKQPKIIIKGCILPSDKKIFAKLDCEFSLRGLSNSQIEKEKPKTGLVEIGQGCNNFCSYCVVPYTRGREKYRSPLLILKEVKYLLKQGIKDITLIAQNVNSYRYKIKNQKSKVKNINQKLKINKKNQKTAEEQTIAFKDLLEMVNNIKGDFKIGFLTNHPKDMPNNLIKTIASLPKVKKEIHLPLQSGSNKILKAMNRKYTKTKYLKLVEKIRKQIPQVRLTTDIIVGFPGETKKDFQDTFEVMKKARFNQAFIAKYSPRTGTAAFNLKDNVPLEEKKKREQTLLKIN